MWFNSVERSGLEGYAKATVRLDKGAVASFAMPMADLELTRGRVELWEGLGTDLRPCIVASGAGLGQVIFVGVDLDQRPIANWSARVDLAKALLALIFNDGEAEAAVRVETAPQSHVGNTDLVGQLRGALDQFRNVKLIPFSWIAGIAAIYILVMGPLDYWLLSRTKRREWTWLTFSLTVAGFTLLATWLAFSLERRGRIGAPVDACRCRPSLWTDARHDLVSSLFAEDATRRYRVSTINCFQSENDARPCRILARIAR